MKKLLSPAKYETTLDKEIQKISIKLKIKKLPKLETIEDKYYFVIESNKQIKKNKKKRKKKR